MFSDSYVVVIVALFLAVVVAFVFVTFLRCFCRRVVLIAFAAAVAAVVVLCWSSSSSWLGGRGDDSCIFSLFLGFPQTFLGHHFPILPLRPAVTAMVTRITELLVADGSHGSEDIQIHRNLAPEPSPSRQEAAKAWASSGTCFADCKEPHVDKSLRFSWGVKKMFVDALS